MGKEPPPTKDALFFQLALTSPDKAKAKPVSGKYVSPTPQYPGTNTSASQSASTDHRNPALVMAPEDPKYNFLNYAKKYFATPKRQKVGSYGKSTLSKLTGTAVFASSFLFHSFLSSHPFLSSLFAGHRGSPRRISRSAPSRMLPPILMTQRSPFWKFPFPLIP